MDISLRLKKRLSYLLRHNPTQFGVVLTVDGKADINVVAEVLETTPDIIQQIVVSDSKNRYNISDDMIWAVQGHSIPVKLPFFKHTVDTVPVVGFHGTQTSNLTSIFSEGLVAKSRQFVHVSKTIETAVEVGNRRKGTVTILEISLKEMVENGLEVLEASNETILTESIPLEYIKEQVRRKE